MRHRDRAAFLENTPRGQYNVGSDIALKLLNAHHYQLPGRVSSNETPLFINELSKLSQNPQSSRAKGSQIVLRNNVITHSFLTTLPEIKNNVKLNRVEMQLQHQKQHNINNLASPTNTSIIFGSGCCSKSDLRVRSSPLMLQKANGMASNQTSDTLWVNSSLGANFRQNTRHLGQEFSQDVRSSQDGSNTHPVINKETVAEMLQSKPNNHTTVEVMQNSSRARNRLPAEALIFTLNGAERFEVVPKSQTESWTQFKSHINTIDDVSSINTQHSIKSFRCSSAFRTVLADMGGNCDTDTPSGSTKRNSNTVNIAIYATKFLGKVKALNKFKSSPNGIHSNGRRAEKSSQSGEKSVETSKKGWELLKKRVIDFKLHKRMRQASETQDVPVESIKELSGFERTRRDLYERYGIIPTTRNDGTVTRENLMLSERPRHLSERADQSYTKSKNYNNLPNVFPAYGQTVSLLK